MNISETFFALLHMKICPNATWDNRHLTEDDIKQLYSLAKAHDLSQFIASALNDIGILPEGDQSKLQNTMIRTMWRFEKMNYELERICRVLEENKIDYMPLKGAVIRPYYPEPWMRTSCDIDILVHEEDLELMSELLVRELNYVLDREDGALRHIWMHAPNGVNFEPHFNLHENSDKLDLVLDEVWANSSLKEGCGHHYIQSPEFLMFHVIVHMSGHFLHGGCGIKPFIDLYLLEQSLDYDNERLMDFCTRAGVWQFYKCVRQVIDVWFNGLPHTDITRRIENYILAGGVYGTTSNVVAIEQKKAGGKSLHLLKRVFMPYNSLKIKYPILVKYPYLTPIYEVVRWIQMLRKKKLGQYTRELDMIRNLDETKLLEICQLLDDVGL
jgi:hypothetical protein